MKYMKERRKNKMAVSH